MGAASGVASPTADAWFTNLAPASDGGGTTGEAAAAGSNIWAITLTVLLLFIAYDQCKLYQWPTYLPTGDLLARHTKLTCSLVKYIWNKGSITGPAFKLPFMGLFLESIRPDIDKYKAKWASGELSCVSVFHKSVAE